MSEPKTLCTRCGVEFLMVTANRTGGVCMRCINGIGDGYDSFRIKIWREAGMDPSGNVRWQQSPVTSDILSTCKGIIGGEIGSVEGSRTLVKCAEMVWCAHGDKWIHPDWDIFVTVESAASELLSGIAPELLSPESARKQDDQKRTIEALYSAKVKDAARKLLADADDPRESTVSG